MTQRNDSTTPPREAVTPVGINHLVLNVRNIEESHAFWTEIMGFKQVGELHPRPDRPNPPTRCSSRGHHKERTNHHDPPLTEIPTLPPPSAWSMSDIQVPINHVPITLPSREAWLKQLAFLQRKGVTFHRRINHGMTHS